MLIIKNIFISFFLLSFVLGIENSLLESHTDLLSLFSSINSDIYDDLNTINFIESNNLENDFFEALDVFNNRLVISLNNPNFILQVEHDDIQLFKNDSNYFTQLKKDLNTKNQSKIISTIEFVESNKVWSESTLTPFDYFVNNFVLSFQYTNSINSGIGTNVSSYRNGYDIDIWIFHPDVITLLDKSLLLGLGLGAAYIPVVNRESIRISSLSFNLTQYLNQFPVSISPSISVLKHSDFGISGSFGVLASYYIPFDYFKLLIGIEYTKIIDIREGPSFDFSAQDLFGINITLVKDIIFN